MESNTNKCHVKFGMSNITLKRPYKLGNETLKESEKESDLGVMVNKKLTSGHIKEKVRHKYSLLVNMRMALTNVDKVM